MEPTSVAGSSIGLTGATVPQLRLYRRRWVILGCTALFGMMAGQMGQALAPISSIAQEYWDVGTTEINALLLPFSLLILLFTFPASRIIDAKGLSFAFILGAAVQLLGGIIRALSGNIIEPSKGVNYGLMLAGQAIVALSTTIYLASPSRVANNWFPPKERTFATSIASLMNVLGMALSFALAPVIVREPNDIPTWALIQVCCSLVVLILVIAFVRSRPPIPPSLSAATPRENIQWKSVLKALASDRNYILLVVSFGVAIGGFTALAGLMNQTLVPEGYSENQVGIVGVLLIVPGLAAAFMIGILVDRTKKYKLVFRTGMGIATASALGFVFFMGPDRFALLAVLICITGIFGVGMLPVAIELASECMYPVSEVACTSFLFAVGALLTAVFLFGLDALKKPGGSMQNALYVLGACIFGSWICTLLYSGSYRRLEYERRKASVDKKAHEDTQPPEIELTAV